LIRHIFHADAITFHYAAAFHIITLIAFSLALIFSPLFSLSFFAIIFAFDISAMLY